MQSSTGGAFRRLILKMSRFGPVMLLRRGWGSVKKRGVRETVRAVNHRLFYSKNYSRYLKRRCLPSEQELVEQRGTQFEKTPVFSVVVPLYNTPERYLKEMLDSVCTQTYPYWELCLADGSDVEHPEVEKICCDYAKKDSRIRYQKLEKNEGISENTNRAVEMAEGDYIALLDHDDLLHPSALFECAKAVQDGADFIYSDDMTFEGELSHVLRIHFKPDFSPDYLRSLNYICHLSVYSRELAKHAGKFSDRYNGSQDYDMILRLTEQAKKVVHIPKVLYFWRSHSASVASDIGAKPYCIESAKRALTDHLERIGLKGQVSDSLAPTTYKINYELEDCPLVSILIPNREQKTVLKTCLDSILEKSTYPNYEIVIIENNSISEEIFSYYEEIQKNKRIRVVRWEGEGFNFSALNNFGAQNAWGKYLLLLNNDVEVITPDWIEEMLMYAQRKDVGAVGAKLYYPDGTIQHAGIILGIGGIAGHSHKGYDGRSYGYFNRLTVAQNLSAVTAACLLVRRDVFEQVGGMDETLQVAFNDVDFCLKVRETGYLNVFTPYAELYHYESKSRGVENTPEKEARFAREVCLMQERWGQIIQKGDPYYNPNLTLNSEKFLLS